MALLSYYFLPIFCPYGSSHLPQMILQNGTLWLGGDGIGESLIPNQSPVSAGSNVHLSSFFCFLELRYKTEMYTLQGWHWEPVLAFSLGPFFMGPWGPEPPGSSSSNNPPLFLSTQWCSGLRNSWVITTSTVTVLSTEPQECSWAQSRVLGLRNDMRFHWLCCSRLTKYERYYLFTVHLLFLYQDTKFS